MNDFSTLQIISIGLIFVWTGFVRTGIGFGGAALGLPLLLLVHDSPLYFLPMIGLHLIFFTSLTLSSRIHNVNWSIIWKMLAIMIIPKVIGIMGLLSFPNTWLVLLVFSITLTYGFMWTFNVAIQSKNRWLDVALLMLGGYVSGTSLIGAPLIVAVVMKYVSKTQLRETLFVLWFILVAFKMFAFAVMGVDFHWLFTLLLLPLAGIGHYIGLKTHEHIVKSDNTQFHRIIGIALIFVSSVGLIKTFL